VPQWYCSFAQTLYINLWYSYIFK